jgi:hypothetical protein
VSTLRAKGLKVRKVLLIFSYLNYIVAFYNVYLIYAPPPPHAAGIEA